MKRWILSVFISVAALSQASAVEVLFGGLALDGAPSVQEEFDRQLRENLAGTANLTLVDGDAAGAVARTINLERYPALSRGLVESMLRYVPDSTILVWGRVREYSFGVKRRSVLASAAYADLCITLNIYSLRFATYAFAGDIRSHTEIPKGWIGFSRVDRIVHVTAQDRVTLSAGLVEAAARQCADIIATMARTEVQKEKKIGSVKRYEEPSVSSALKPSQQPGAKAAGDTLPASSSSAPGGDSSAVRSGNDTGASRQRP